MYVSAAMTGLWVTEDTNNIYYIGGTIMKTIRPFNSDEMRIKASERIHKMFKGAPFIFVKYKNTFAEGYCQYKDGTTAFFTVWYRDMLVHSSEDVFESQHDRAVAYIKSLPKQPWAS